MLRDHVKIEPRKLGDERTTHDGLFIYFQGRLRYRDKELSET